MMHGSECDIDIWWPSVENVALGRDRASSVLSYGQPLA